jgi:ribulose-phosphate 3-epimerase
MHNILPGILEKDWESLENRINLVKPFAKAVHIDLLDGKFAPNTTLLDPEPFKAYAQEIFFELHMMVDEPITYLQPWADSGIQRFIGHVEKMSDQVAFVAEAQRFGEVVLAIDAKTPVDAIRVPFSDLDGLLVMTVNAGFSNQSFLPECLEKVQHLAQKTTIPIEVDGGVNDETMKLAYHAGARRFVSTGFLFKGNPEVQYTTLSHILTTLTR